MGESVDYRISALLRGVDARWNAFSSLGTPTVVTYGFLESVPDCYRQPIAGFSAQDYATFAALDEAHREVVRAEFAEIERSISGLRFVELSDAQAAIIRFGLMSYDVVRLGDANGYAPNGGDTSGNLDAAGDVWFNRNSLKLDLDARYTMPNGTVISLGKTPFADMALHEICHALGLKHPGNYGQYGGAGLGSNGPPYLPAGEDTSTNTVMSYYGDYAGPELRPYDIMALSYLYGASAPASGGWVLADDGDATIRGSSLNELIVLSAEVRTIDGAGGIDTVVCSGARAGYSVNAGSGGFVLASTGGTGSSCALMNIERVHFSDKAFALDIGGNGGQVYRIYQAAFNRQPDLGGLGDWIYGMDHGMSLLDVANGFIGSAEFRTLYGSNPTDAEYVNRLYQNVLHRSAEPAGYDYWMNQLALGLQARNQVLVNFSESPENQAQVLGVIQNGFEYMLHQA